MDQTLGVWVPYKPNCRNRAHGSAVNFERKVDLRTLHIVVIVNARCILKIAEKWVMDLDRESLLELRFHISKEQGQKWTKAYLLESVIKP